MRILVMGAGSMGSVVGGFMARAGHEVTLVGRPKHMQAVAAHGLHISGIWGEHCVLGMSVHTDAAAVPPADFDLIVLSVKSYDTPAAAKAMALFVGPETLVCAYQNGLGNAEHLAECFGWERVIGARAIYGVRLSKPGHVEITVIANPTALGVFVPEAPVARVREITRAMDAAGLPTVYVEAIQRVIWGKVAYNCALNPLSALLDVPYGRLAEIPETRAIMAEIIQELYAVAKAMRIGLEPREAEAYLEHFYSKLVPPTAVHYASMREDLRHGRRTEVDALNGALVRYGAAHGVSTPANQLLTRLIHAREQVGAGKCAL